MKSTFKKISMFMLLSFICSTTYRSYAEPVSDMASEEVKTPESLKTAQTKSTTFYGSGKFTGAWNYKVKDKELITWDAGIDLGMEKTFVFQEDKLDSKVEINATTKKIELGELFATYNYYTVGLTDSLFSESAMQVTAKTKCLESFTVGVSAEQAKELNFYGTNDAMKKLADKSNFKPINYIPAVSGMVKYDLPNQLGDVTVSGLCRFLAWKDSTTKKDIYKTPGLGVKISANMPCKYKTRTVTFSCILGQSIGEYIPFLKNLDSEPISIRIAKDSKTIERIIAGSINVSYEHHFTNAIRAKISATGVKAFQPSRDKKEQADKYDIGLYGTLNLSYWFTEYTSFGLEYVGHHRKNVAQKIKDGGFCNSAKAILGFKF